MIPTNRPVPLNIDALIAGLIRDELGLPQNPPQVVTYNSNLEVPANTRIYVVVGYLVKDNYGEGSGYANSPDGTELLNNQQVASANIVTVDAFSVSGEAWDRLNEITMALTGDSAERLAEQNSLQIYRPTDWSDLSAVEASRRLNRYQCQFAVYQSASRSRPVPFMEPKEPFIGKLLVNP